MTTDFIDFLDKVGKSMEDGVIELFDKDGNIVNLESLTVFDIGMEYTIGKMFEKNGGPMEIALDDLPQMMKDACGDDIERETCHLSFFNWWKTIKCIDNLLNI